MFGHFRYGFQNGGGGQMKILYSRKKQLHRLSQIEIFPRMEKYWSYKIGLLFALLLSELLIAAQICLSGRKRPFDHHPILGKEHDQIRNSW